MLAGMFTVPGTSSNFNTGLTLSGNTVFITASGAWTCLGPVGGSPCQTGPNGTGTPGHHVPPFLAEGLSEFSLIARVGSGPWQFVGAGPTAISGTGVLTFAMNDTFWGDNQGSMVVKVTSLGLTSPIVENGTTTLTGSFIDPGTLDVHKVTINWGDGNTEAITLPVGARAFSATHQYLDDNPTGTTSDIYNVSVTVSDDDTGSNTQSTGITVSNVAPANVSVNVSLSSINENDSVTLSGSFTDPGVEDTHTVVINWGDGSPDTTLNLGAGVLAFSGVTHQYLDDGASPGNGTPSDVHIVTVTVTDDDTGVGSGGTAVTVNNVAPVLDAGVDQNVLIGTPLSVSANFTDVGTLDTWTYSIDWGDGTSIDTGSATAGVPITGSHLYVVTGPRTVTVCVTDDYTGSDCDSLVVDFLSGSGKITAGVLRFDNNGRGGFNVQSNKNGSVKGELEYHNGAENLHAHTLTHIAIYDNGTKGWFAGVLTDGRTFVAYVEDNGEPGKSDVFKQWGEGVLLNGDGQLTGGNVQIH